MTARLRAAWARLVLGTGEEKRGFAMRLFWTSAAVYALFFNPYVQSSMTWNYLDLKVSLIETGRPYPAHTAEYDASDTAHTPWGPALGLPPGPSFLLIPLQVLLRAALGPNAASLAVLNVVAILVLSIPAMEPHYDINAFPASLGLRYLLPAVPLLVASLAGLEGTWRRLAGWLGLFSIMTVIASHRIPAADLWRDPGFPTLVAPQLAFRLLSLLLLAGVAAVLARARFSASGIRRERVI